MENKYKAWDGKKMHIVAEFDCARQPAFWFRELRGWSVDLVPHSGEVYNRNNYPDWELIRYTGRTTILSNKGRVEIYEWDFVKVLKDSLDTVDEIYEVRWDNSLSQWCLFCVKSPNSNRLGTMLILPTGHPHLLMYSVYEVLGNRFEHSHLIS